MLAFDGEGLGILKSFWYIIWRQKEFPGSPCEQGLVSDSYGWAHITPQVRTTAMFMGNKVMLHMSINWKRLPHLSQKQEFHFLSWSRSLWPLCLDSLRMAVIQTARCRSTAVAGERTGVAVSHRGSGKWHSLLVFEFMACCFRIGNIFPWLKNQNIKRMCCFEKPHFHFALMDHFSSPAPVTWHLLVSSASLCKQCCCVLYSPPPSH